MKINIYKDYNSLSKATAQLIMNYIRVKSNSLICLASGHTPLGVFEELSIELKKGNLDLEKCRFLSLDEWLHIDPHDSGSCLSMLQRDCFTPLGIAPNQVDFFNVNAADLNKECERINQLISDNGGLDIMLVGVGTNGHIGMNEPGTSFDSLAHVSRLAEETIRVGQKYFDNPTRLSEGITLGLRHLQEAKLPIVMASGDKKASVLGRAVNEPVSKEMPVSLIQTINQGFVMLDEPAAQFIKKI